MQLRDVTMINNRLFWTNLEIKVGYFSSMEVVDSFEDLLDELSGLFLTKRLLLGKKVKQLTSRDPATQTSIIQLKQFSTL